MKYIVILSPGARRDIHSASDWYSGISQKLAIRFEQHVRETIITVATFPYAHLLVHQRFRQAVVRTFPYLIYFEIRGRFVKVVALVHQRQRRPRKMT